MLSYIVIRTRVMAAVQALFLGAVWVRCWGCTAGAVTGVVQAQLERCTGAPARATGAVRVLHPKQRLQCPPSAQGLAR
jgi:hypothetical protein